jgi:hypothetical protein
MNLETGTLIYKEVESGALPPWAKLKRDTLTLESRMPTCRRERRSGW